MHRRGARLERLVRSRHRDAALADGLDLVGPRIDERHIVAGTRQERPEVASDGSSADEEHLLAHVAHVRGLTFDDVLLVPGYNGIKSRQYVTTSVQLLGRTFVIP